VRSDAGCTPSSGSTLRTDVAATTIPAPLSSPTMRRCHQGGFSRTNLKIIVRREGRERRAVDSPLGIGQQRATADSASAAACPASARSSPGPRVATSDSALRKKPPMSGPDGMRSSSFSTAEGPLRALFGAPSGCKGCRVVSAPGRARGYGCQKSVRAAGSRISSASSRQDAYDVNRRLSMVALSPSRTRPGTTTAP
jgi:hypothetical protein